jgi:CubicO group peptidase (beta-lactamase class C family)
MTRAAREALHGSCDARFAALREALEVNFAEHGEHGAALAVTLEGVPVVDLWGGWADAEGTRRWARETIVDVFSVGKPMAAMCLLRLIEGGAVDLDAPVARYWPEFAAAGKEATTVRMILGHRAGLPAIRSELAADDIYDWQAITSALAGQAPWWEPGTTHGYHVNTFGFLVGELVRRVAGEPLGLFFARSITEPLGADFQFGLAADEQGRVADFLFPDVPSFADVFEPGMVRSAYANPPGISGVGTVNTARWRAAEIPSANGHANARAVARLYAALAGGGSIDGVRVLEAATVALAASEVSSGHDALLDRPSRFGLGFQLTQPERPLGPSPNAFGHFGAGGALGFADPDAGIAFGYTPNQGYGPRWQNPRNRGLIAALYASL